VKLTTQLDLVPTSINRGAIPYSPIHLYGAVLRQSTGTTLPLTLLKNVADAQTSSCCHYETSLHEHTWGWMLLTEHQALKAYWGMEVYLRTFLTSALA
jgi:hypothetical protein